MESEKKRVFCLNYHKREINKAKADDIGNNVIESWYDLAWKVYFRMFRDYIEEREDLVQEAVIRLWELSGKEGTDSFGYKWSICVNAMRSWLNNGFSRRLSSEKAEDNNYIFDIECVDKSYLNFELWGGYWQKL
jgi:DNA-directed RNA polymerase specialized sigma24 family protein